MMILKQNINFYQVEEEYAPALSLTRMLQVWLALIIILGILAIQAKWVEHGEANKLKSLNHEREAVNAELITMSKALKAKNNPQKLQAELNTLQEQISKTQAAIEKLQSQENNDHYHLFAYLEGFASAHVKGTYISHFLIQNEGGKMVFEGDALAPQLIPQMVQSWEKNTVMKGRRFQKLNISRIKENNQWVKFNLQAQ
ncbi:MAG: hypothetical protein AB7V32_10965 [Candidatus Berkiella sp.]